jgi:hypothetical protein
MTQQRELEQHCVGVASLAAFLSALKGNMARLPSTAANFHLAIVLCLLHHLINDYLLADAAIVEHTFHVHTLESLSLCLSLF